MMYFMAVNLNCPFFIGEVILKMLAYIGIMKN